MLSFSSKRKKRGGGAAAAINKRSINYDSEEEDDVSSRPKFALRKPAKKQNRFQTQSNQIDKNNDGSSSEGDFDEAKFKQFKAGKAKKLKKQYKKHSNRLESNESDKCTQPVPVQSTGPSYSAADLEALRQGTNFKSFTAEEDQHETSTEKVTEIPSSDAIQRAKLQRRNIDN